MAEAEEVIAEVVEEEVVVEPTKAYCFHCGRPSEVNTEENTDWLCPHCQRYQMAVVCPTCHSVVNMTTLPQDVAPKGHASYRRAQERAGEG